METYKIKIVETLVVIIGYIVIQFINKTFINNTLKQTYVQRARRKMIVKALQLFSFLTLILVLAAIWGLEQNEIAVFIGTIITALGIAFFAQWSLLSNITSSLLLFFNHPLKIGDKIKVLDKDFPFEGEITDLTYFFIHIKSEQGELITVPNSQIFQKSISIISTQIKPD